MTLPNATLFPQALIPLYIFEPRYRQMLRDALDGHRMFIVAMQKPGVMRESPSPVAGLGLIRVSVGHQDGTSHLILQGLTRVELESAVRYKPYRIQRIRPLAPIPSNEVTVDALVIKVRELLARRFKLGLPFPFPIATAPTTTKNSSKWLSSPTNAKEILGYLDQIDDPEQVADLVSCAVLSGARERQSILETVELEQRLRLLIRFLLAENERQKKKDDE